MFKKNFFYALIVSLVGVSIALAACGSGCNKGKCKKGQCETTTTAAK
jgi:hypothetical protein